MRHLAAVIVVVVASACAGADDGGPAQTSVTVVPHQTLEGFLPDLPGWSRLEPKGDTDTVESVSRVTVDYERPSDASTMSVELMDSSLREDVLALIKEALAGKNPELTPTTLGELPAAEEWTEEAKRGSVHVLVAGRFMVVVSGWQVAGLGEIRSAAQKIDLKKLGSLK